MEEEVKDPLGILNNNAAASEAIPLKENSGDPLGILKKKGKSDSNLTSSSVSSEGAKPLEQSSQKSTYTGELDFNNHLSKIGDKSIPAVKQPKKDVSFTAAIKDMVSGYNKPADPKDVVPSPFINAVKRGSVSAEQADIVGPFADKPDNDKIKRLAELQKSMDNIPASEAYQKFNQSKGLNEALKNFTSNPVKILAELTGESLSAMAQYGGSRIATGAATGAALGSVVPGVGTASGAGSGIMVGLADTSLGLEYTSKFIESLMDAGVDMKDPESIKKAFGNEDLISSARSSALKKGIPIAIFDLISGGVAGKIISKPAKSIVGKIGQGAIEFATQALMDASGEAAGELTSGEDLSAPAIIGEAVGGIGTTPIEVGIAGATFNAPVDDVVKVETEKVNSLNIPGVDVPAENIQAKVENSNVENNVIEKGTKDGLLQQEQGEVTQTRGEDTGTTIQTKEPEVQGESRIQKIINDNDEQKNQSSGEGIGDVRSGTVQDTNSGGQPSLDGGTPAPDSNGDKTNSTSADTRDELPSESSAIKSIQETEEQKVSGIKKALVSDEKIESTDIEKRSTEQMLTKAKEQVDNGDLNPKGIVDEIANGKARALQPDEVAGLVYYKTQLDNRSDTLNNKLVDAISSGDKESEIQARIALDAVSRELDDYNTMSLKTAYEQSLAFRMRQMLLNNEYNLQSQVSKYKAVNNGIISPEVEAKFRDLDQKLKEANERLQKLEDEKKLSSSSNVMRALKEDSIKRKERRLKIVTKKKENINNFFDSLKIKSDPNKLNNIFQVVGEATWNGSLEIVKQSIIAGADVATAIKNGVDYITEQYRGNDFNSDEYAKTLQPGLEKLINDSEEQNNIGSPSINKDNKLVIPASLIRAIVESGVDTIEELTEQVHSLVKETVPEASLRDVRDAITRYGETRNLSKNEIDVKIREIKRVGKLISALEDVQNKIRPLRSGLQRDKLTDEERRMQKQLRNEMKDLPVDDVETERQWRTALDAVKSRLKNQIADLENQIETGKKSIKKKGIEYDQEANELREQRDKLKAIIETIEGKDKLSDEEKVRRAIRAVEKTAIEYQRKINEKDFKAKENSKTPETPELKAARDKRDQIKEVYRELERELGVADKKKLDSYKKAVTKSIKRYEDRIKNGEFITPKKNAPTLDEEAIKLKLERDKIKFEFDVAQEKNRRANRPMSDKVWDVMVDLWNIPKSLVSTIDMSAVLRQGAILTAANPISGAKAFSEMIRQTFSKKREQEWLMILKDTPEFQVMRQAKLYIAEPNAKLSAKEEAFVSNFASKIPVFGAIVAASERAYTGYLNKLRVDVFLNGSDRLRENGFTPESNPDAYKAWANFINNASGRGNLGALENSAVVLNNFFFSPRYLASRVNLLNPVTYSKMPPAVRKMALKNMISFVGFGVLTLSLAAAGGADVEIDPRSSDFGKIKFGNTRYDMWAGFQQVIRLIAQIATGQKKSSSTGKITELDGKSFPGETRGDVALRFLRSKASPSAGIMYNALTGKDVMGNEVTIQGELVRNTVPLYIQDIQSIYEEEGTTGVLRSAIPAFFGIGVQSYDQKSGLSSDVIDPGKTVYNLNKKHKYAIHQITEANLSDSMDHEVDDDTFGKFNGYREAEIKRLFDRYQNKLDSAPDNDIYEKYMNSIVKEATRSAKYKIAKENKWSSKDFKRSFGNPYKLPRYRKEDGKWKYVPD